MFWFTEIQCKSPDTKDELIYKVKSYKIGGTVEYSCAKGHTLKGNSTRMCLRKGSWSGILPTCQGKLYLDQS